MLASAASAAAGPADALAPPTWAVPVKSVWVGAAGVVVLGLLNHVQSRPGAIYLLDCCSHGHVGVDAESQEQQYIDFSSTSAIAILPSVPITVSCSRA